jgi:hypothetical protein
VAPHTIDSCDRSPPGRSPALSVRFGCPQRIRDKGQQQLPADEVWLIGEHRISGEKKYILPTYGAHAHDRAGAPVYSTLALERTEPVLITSPS